jgi:hypothetical protein
MRRWCFRLGLSSFSGWLLTVAAVLFDTSDPDDAPFRVSSIGHVYAKHEYYPSCGNGTPRKLDTWENVGYHYHEVMRRIDWSIADWKGEPTFDFDWLERRTKEFDRRRRAGRSAAEGMKRPGLR